MIRELTLADDYFQPGETLNHEGGEHTHITITYNISGGRELVDRQIEKAIENDDRLLKIEHVNTTLYWQVRLGDSDDSKDRLIEKTKSELKKKLGEIFDDSSIPSGTKVTVFCMVGNLRAFAYKLT